VDIFFVALIHVLKCFPYGTGFLPLHPPSPALNVCDVSRYISFLRQIYVDTGFYGWLTG
jgi:hypothetical protein